MAEPIRTLVVDDEPGIRAFLEGTLRRAGHTVVQAASGEDALEQLRDTSFDLAILDLSLGGQVDGLRVLEAIRWRWPGTVAIILTAHGSLESARVAIRDGVDDYLLKPVDADELRAAVQGAIDRRKRMARVQEQAPTAQLYQRGPFVIDLSKRLVTRDGAPLDLTTGEFTLLVHLAQNAHRVVSAREIVRVVQQYEADDQYEAQQIVKWYIHRLRRKIEPEPSRPRYILTVRGSGYRFGE